MPTNTPVPTPTPAHTPTPEPTATPVSAEPMTFVSGFVIVSGAPIPPNSMVTAKIGSYESDPVSVGADGAFNGLFVDPQDTGAIGQQIDFLPERPRGALHVNLCQRSVREGLRHPGRGSADADSDCDGCPNADTRTDRDA